MTKEYSILFSLIYLVSSLLPIYKPGEWFSYEIKMYHSTFNRSRNDNFNNFNPGIFTNHFVSDHDAEKFRGTKRLVSVNSAGIFVSKVPPAIFAIKGKWMPIIFGGKKTAVLGAIKAQLPFSEGKRQLLNSWNTIPFPTIFYHLNFQLPHPNRSNNVSSHIYPF